MAIKEIQSHQIQTLQYFGEYQRKCIYLGLTFIYAHILYRECELSEVFYSSL